MKSVYLICSESLDGNRIYKIGITKRDIENRLKEFRTGNCSNLYLVDLYKSEWASKIESQLHKIFMAKRISGEWFNLDANDLVLFKEKCNLIHSNLELISTQNTYYLERGRF